MFIAVDQKLNGGKLRVLAKTLDCSENEARGMLVNLWLWGTGNCTSGGLIIGAGRKDIIAVIGSGLSCHLKPEHVVDILITLDWIEERDDGLYIHDWEEWHRIPCEYRELVDREKERRKKNREKTARYRSKPKEKQVEPLAQQDKAALEPVQMSLPIARTEERTEKKAKEKTRSPSQYPDSFEAFWAVYPRKVDKGQAYKKYQARLKDGYSQEDLIQAARRYASQCGREHTEQKYIKHAKTFLGDSAPFAEFIIREEQSGKAPYDESNPYAGLI